jgi:hypothetical protein
MHENKSFCRAGVLPYAVFFLLIGISLDSCIKRDNQFDPIFKKKTVSSCTPDTLQAFKSRVLKILFNLDNLARNAMTAYDSLQGTDSVITELLDSNNSILNHNAGIFQENISTKNQNYAQQTTDSLKFLKKMDTLLFFQMPTTPIRELLSGLSYDSIALFSLPAAFINHCPEFDHQVDSIMDSASGVFIVRTDSILWLKSSIESREISIDRLNLSVYDSNIVIKQENYLAQLYNDSIHRAQWIVRIQSFPAITTGESLDTLERAQAGDTFIVQGALSLSRDHLQLRALRGTASNHIAIIGSPLIESSISASNGIFIDTCEYVDFCNLSIIGSRLSGIKLDNLSNNILLSNCIFEGNERYGVEISFSGVTVTDCIIRHNGLGGILFASYTSNFWLNISNVLIVKNSGVGIELTTPLANLKFVTISNNASDGIRIVAPNGSSSSIFNSIISFNGGFGVSMVEENFNGMFDCGSVDLFQNYSGNLSPNIPGGLWNFDPNFTDTAGGDFSIAPSGKVYELETENKLTIGYRR